jgi:hypothetical protein
MGKEAVTILTLLLWCVVAGEWRLYALYHPIAATIVSCCIILLGAAGLACELLYACYSLLVLNWIAHVPALVHAAVNQLGGHCCFWHRGLSGTLGPILLPGQLSKPTAVTMLHLAWGFRGGSELTASARKLAAEGCAAVNSR